MDSPAPYTPLSPAQALRDDVRRKYRDALPGTAQAANWFRLEELLDLSDAEARALTMRADSAATAAAEVMAENRMLLDYPELSWANLTDILLKIMAIPKEAWPARATAQTNTVLYPAGPWTEDMEASRQNLQLEYFAMKKRALAAEARVQELLAELGEQEVDKLALLIELGSRAA